tara:strand:- start:190 stop:456 length:267 start_codon:yes stop_codon:yes gene_type:complete
MRPVSHQFEVPINDSTQWCTECDVSGNPRWEKQNLSIETPLWVPWETNVLNSESFNHDIHPTEDSNDENHGKHHRFHHRHLQLRGFWH